MNKEIQINLKKPTLNQRFILQNKKRFNVIRAGRRFGKTEFGKYELATDIKHGLPLCWISTTYKTLEPVFIEFKQTFNDIILSKNEQQKKLYLINGTVIDFWSFENIESVRGSKYRNMILDECAKEKKLDYYWSDILRATLVDYKGKATFISTPKGDNFFRYLDNKHLTNDKWRSFHFTTYDNEKLDKDEIDDMIKDLPVNSVKQEILAEYIDATGSMVKRSDVKYYDEPYSKSNYDSVYIGVDLAISQKDTADYTAISVIGKKSDNTIHYIDAFKDRLTFNNILKTINHFNQKYEPNVVGIESVAFQSAVLQELTRTTNIPVKALTPQKDKITRFLPISAKYENGLIYHNRNLPVYVENEILSFPDSDNDDIVDSLTYAILLALEPTTKVYFF